MIFRHSKLPGNTHRTCNLLFRYICFMVCKELQITIINFCLNDVQDGKNVK